MSSNKVELPLDKGMFESEEDKQNNYMEEEAANIAGAIANLSSYEDLYEDNYEAQKMLNLIHETIERGTPTRASIAREKADLDKRISTSTYAILSAMYLAKAGVPGADQLLKDANDKYEQMKYVRSLIQTNPEEYIANKVTQVMKNMDTFTQGAAYLVGTMKRDKAQAFTSAAQGVQVQAQKQLESLTRMHQILGDEKEKLWNQLTSIRGDKKQAGSSAGKRTMGELQSQIEALDRDMDAIRISFKDIMGVYKKK